MQAHSSRGRLVVDQQAAAGQDEGQVNSSRPCLYRSCSSFAGNKRKGKLAIEPSRPSKHEQYRQRAETLGIIRRCDETGKRENKGEDECKGVTGVKRQMRGGGGGVDGESSPPILPRKKAEKCRWPYRGWKIARWGQSE